MKHKFKTNINCGGCIEKVSPFMDKAGIEDWKVDTKDPQKVLTVESKALSKDEIMEIVKEAGFKIEEVRGGLFSRLLSK
ncbi:MAG: hypothetical protein MRZ79_11920 [Bacteroidia bacterium]|nr:hypothetical protein [Bacteroidia bacterium]